MKLLFFPLNFFDKIYITILCVYKPWVVYVCLNLDSTGVARAFPGGRIAHPEHKNEEEKNEKFEEN